MFELIRCQFMPFRQPDTQNNVSFDSFDVVMKKKGLTNINVKMERYDTDVSCVKVCCVVEALMGNKTQSSTLSLPCEGPGQAARKGQEMG